ncbi:unnamed protein product, partial [Porites evermanni]
KNDFLRLTLRRSYKWMSNTSGKRRLTTDFSRQCSQREVYKRSIPETGPIGESNMADKKRAVQYRK